MSVFGKISGALSKDGALRRPHFRYYIRILP